MTGQQLSEPEEWAVPPADRKEKGPAVEESKGLLPQLERAMHWVWERLLSAPPPAPLLLEPGESSQGRVGTPPSWPHQGYVQGTISTGWSNTVCLWQPWSHPILSDQRGSFSGCSLEISLSFAFCAGPGDRRPLGQGQAEREVTRQPGA